MSNRDSREVSDCSVVWWQCVCCHFGYYDGESLLNCCLGRVKEGFINEYIPSAIFVGVLSREHIMYSLDLLERWFHIEHHVFSDPCDRDNVFVFDDVVLKFQPVFVCRGVRVLHLPRENVEGSK